MIDYTDKDTKDGGIIKWIMEAKKTRRIALGWLILSLALGMIFGLMTAYMFSSSNDPDPTIPELITRVLTVWVLIFSIGSLGMIGMNILEKGKW